MNARARLPGLDPAQYPSVRLARVRWLRPDVRCMNLEPRLRGELLAEMQAVIDGTDDHHDQ